MNSGGENHVIEKAALIGNYYFHYVCVRCVCLFNNNNANNNTAGKWVPNGKAQMRYVSETTKRVIIGNRLVKGETNCIKKELYKDSQTFHGLKEEVKSYSKS